MKNLISMTDFVLYQDNGMHQVVAYANFLKQPLELWMFVPCKLVDGVWVVMEDPDNIYTIDSEEFYECATEYQQAKERCLFEGCVYDDVMQEIRSEKGIVLFYLPKEKLFTIEDLVKYNLQLTHTDLKQIGL